MMLTQKLQLFTKIYKLFDPSFSLICYYSFIFILLWISIGLSVFGFVSNEYQWIAIRSLSTIHNIWSGIWWTNPKIKKQLFAVTKFQAWPFGEIIIEYLAVILWLKWHQWFKFTKWFFEMILSWQVKSFKMVVHSDH